MRSSIISAVALLAACAPSPDSPDRETSTAVQPRVGYTEGGGTLSRRVYATWFGERRDDAVDLLLLVLWRGAPGWQTGPYRGGGRLPPRSAEGAPEHPGVPSPIVHEMRIGSVEFGIHFDLDSRTVRLIGEEVALGDRNVILVDRIDGAGGPPRIANVLRIGPRLPTVRRSEPEGMRSDCLAVSLSAGDSMESATRTECEDRWAPRSVDIHAVVRQSPELRAFVGPGMH